MKWVEVKPPWSRPHCRSCQKKVAINRWTTMNLSRLHGAKESFKEYVVTSFYKINYMYPQSWSPKSTWQCLRCDMEVPILLCHFRYWTGSLDVTAWRHRASASTFYVSIIKRIFHRQNQISRPRIAIQSWLQSPSGFCSCCCLHW